MTTNIFIVEKQTVYEIDCNQELVVPDDGNEYTAADLVYAAGLNKARGHKETIVKPGKYVVRMLAMVTENPGEPQIVGEPTESPI